MAETINSSNKVAYAEEVAELFSTTGKRMEDGGLELGAVAKAAKYAVVDRVNNEFVDAFAAYGELRKTTDIALTGMLNTLLEDKTRGQAFLSKVRAALDTVSLEGSKVFDFRAITETRDGHEVWTATEKAKLKGTLETLIKVRLQLIQSLADLNHKYADPSMNATYNKIGQAAEMFANSFVRSYNNIGADLKALNVKLDDEYTSMAAAATKITGTVPTPKSVLEDI